MSHSLINHSNDLKKLRDEGYEIVVIANYIVVKNVPYVNCNNEILYADIISELTLAGNCTTRPSNHTVYFTGEYPCNHTGKPLNGMVNSSKKHQLADGLVSQHRFSSKPPGGYSDYYEKFITYSLHCLYAFLFNSTENPTRNSGLCRGNATQFQFCR